MFSRLSRRQKAFWLRAVKPLPCSSSHRAGEYGLLNIDEQDAEKFDCQRFQWKVGSVAPLATNRTGGAEVNYGIWTCKRKQE